MKLVIIESPYAGTPEEVKRNELYVRRCLRDSLERGEAPFASHALYTQPGVLNDFDLRQRRIGIKAGFQWADKAELTAVYNDYGISEGMQEGIRHAWNCGRPIEFRMIEKNEGL